MITIQVEKPDNNGHPFSVQIILIGNIVRLVQFPECDIARLEWSKKNLAWKGRLLDRQHPVEPNVSYCHNLYNLDLMTLLSDLLREYFR